MPTKEHWKEKKTWKPAGLAKIVAMLREEGPRAIVKLHREAAWSVELGADLRLKKRGKVIRAKFEAIDEIGLENEALLFQTLVVRNKKSGKNLRLFGFSRDVIAEIAKEINLRRAHTLADSLAERLAPVFGWSRALSKEMNADRWFSLGHLEQQVARKPVLNSATLDLLASKELTAILTAKLTKTQRQHLELWEQVDYEALRTRRNEEYTANEVARFKELFDRIEKHPLTQEQREAAVCFENKTLLIASAGSGKTSTLIAKAAYAVEKNICNPEELLLVAFNKSAAEEMQHRLRQRLGESELDSGAITAGTFHSLGLDILGKASGKKPRLARFISQNRELSAIASMLVQGATESQAIKESIFLLRYVFDLDLPEFDDKDPSFDAWDPEKSERGFQTMRGEIVKSAEERMIADWLYAHGVEYVYETDYKIDTTSDKFSQYQPDFYYPEIDLYHEHFALDEAGDAPAHFEGYLESVHWKRELHAEHKTECFETTSAGIRQGNDLEKLLERLRAEGLDPQLAEDIESPGRKPTKQKALAKLLRTFLSHFKSNRLNIHQIRESIPGNESIRYQARARHFLTLFEYVCEKWQEKLAEERAIDFDDMLNRASDAIENKKYTSPYKVILVDEFQDASHSRAELIRQLSTDQYGHLFCVGDDWQSIYRFAGADPSVMAKFQEQFGKGSVLKLQRTFRFCQQLADVSSAFIQRNPGQLEKAVKSEVARKARQPIELITYSNDEIADDYLEAKLEELYEQAKRTPESTWPYSCTLLGRYKHDAPQKLREWKSRFDGVVEIAFMTVHSSKGLESDFVFVIAMGRGKYGFPSEIEDDSLLSLVIPESDTFPHAEERRLFYVAITRAKIGVSVFSPSQLASEFIAELKAMGVPLSDRGDSEGGEVCPACKKGTLVRRTGRYGEFLGCDRFPKCGHSENVRQPAQE